MSDDVHVMFASQDDGLRSPVSGYDSEEFDEDDPFDEMERKFS